MPARWAVLVGFLAGALLAARNSSPATGSGGGGSAAGNQAVDLHLHGVSGIGTVLTDPSGLTLYTADQEAHGAVECTGACLQVFMRELGASVATPSSVISSTGRITRPDTGARQLTYQGAPLYTYVKDGAWGGADGNGVRDTFGGTHLAWHAVVVTR
jgi:predicted lipoprotein with Yx(FWY)xxD motif